MASSFSHYGQKIRQIYRTHGFKQTVRKSLSRAVKPVYRRFEVVITTRSFKYYPDIDSTGDLTIEPIDQRRLSTLQAFIDEHPRINGARLLNLFRNGYRGFFAMRAGIPIGYIWWVDNQIPRERNHPDLQQFGIDLADDEVYTFDLYIEPESRGRGAATEFVRRVDHTLRERGYVRSYGNVMASNIGARVLYRILGSKDLRQHTCRRIMSFLLISDGRLLVKNTKKSPYRAIGYRELWSFRRL